MSAAENLFMDDRAVFAKTQLGNDEILKKVVGLPNDLRALLLLIDSRRDVATLRKISISLRESTAALTFLEDNGFIVRYDQNEQPNTVVPMQRRGMLADIQESHNQNFAQRPAPVAPTQTAPMPTQPVYAQPSYAPPAPAMAPNYAAPSGPNLNDIKSAMIQVVSQSLGADAGHVLSRIQGAQSLADLQQIARKLYDVLKSYAGVKVAEKFMQQFEGPLQLR
jgi:hypothetical protein